MPTAEQVSIDNELIKEFMEFYYGLTPNLIPYSSAHDRLQGVLPRLPDFLKKLSEGKSKLIGVVLDRMTGTCKYASERRDWDGYVSLSLLGRNEPLDHGDHGLIYVHPHVPFHESVAWIMTRETEERKRGPIYCGPKKPRQDPMWKQEKRFEMLEPAKLYDIWSHVEQDKPVTEFSSVEEILEAGEAIKGKSYLVFPKVRIRGLSISETGVEETSFNIQNWFGDNAVLVSRLPRNHYWDA